MSSFKNKIEESLEQVTSKRVNVYPYKEALYITIWYIILGSCWILFSDTIVNTMVSNPEVVKTIQLIKGWLYVIVTGIYIFILVYIRVNLLKTATDEIHDGYMNISAMSEELLEKEDEIFELSHYDRTSGLLNWTGLSIAFSNLIEMNGEKSYAFYYIDIDNIKHVNDTLGHDNGNLLLETIGSKLKKLTETEGIVSRVSGDEFVLVLPAAEDVVQLHKTASKINKLLKTTWKMDKYEFYVTASIGVAVYPDHGTNLETLMKHSDLAMFIAKDNGKDRHHLYDEAISKRTQNYIEVVSEIRYGISQNEFELYYQPIVDLSSGKISGVEALIRWNHPKKGMLTPYHFIGIAEESGQIMEIGRWVFETACIQQKKWSNQGLDLKVSVNLSGLRLFDKHLLDDMRSALLKTQVNPEYIQVEITETAVMENLHGAQKILQDIKQLGLQIALDDFGTGYSSLTYVQMFPIDVMKFDKKFITNISVKGEEKENSIVNAMINLSHALNLQIVAEGIETHDQAEYLIINSCDYGQGYYYDRPMPVEKFNQKYLK